ncbi:MAG: hypothetical protein M3203_09540 [Actinomycetota bacterium]|nr:hypothetical protein [Actinomycetota bacterium]
MTLAIVTTTTTATAIDHLLNAIRAGAGVPDHLFTPDAELDATVPNWRFSRRGAAALARQYREWFTHAAAFEELERHPFDGGEVVTYLLVWRSGGIAYAAHHCHVLRVDGNGRIAADRFFCGGRWSAALLAEMTAAGDAG